MTIDNALIIQELVDRSVLAEFTAKTAPEWVTPYLIAPRLKMDLPTAFASLGRLEMAGKIRKHPTKQDVYGLPPQ